MSRNHNGESILTSNCPARGDYGHSEKWSLRPGDFRINGLEGADEGEDIIGATFTRSKRDKGHVWRHTVDIGDVVSAAEGERLRSLDATQMRAVGAIMCSRVAECLGAQLDSEGLLVCPALNFERFMEAVDEVAPPCGPPAR